MDYIYRTCLDGGNVIIYLLEWLFLRKQQRNINNVFKSDSTNSRTTAMILVRRLTIQEKTRNLSELNYY